MISVLSGDVSSGFQVRWAALFTLGRGTYDVHSVRFTSSATPVNLFAARMAAEPFLSMYF